MRQLEEKWTPAQKDAIRSRGETLLVSAAAGSGKTAVLTERIIDRLLDEENPLDLSRILVVTFTKAAAGELKSRIRDALNREIAKDPDNHRLRTQLLNVGRAKISTIDSFCLDLIRTNFAALSLSPKVSVADEAQAKLLAKTVMEGLIDDHFDGLITDEANFIPDFGDLCDLFVTTRSAEELAKVLLELYDKVDNFEDGVLWLKKQAENLDFYADADFLAKDNPLSAPLRSRLTAWTEAGDAFYQRAGLFLTDYPEYAKNYGESFSYMGGWFSHLHTLLSDGASYDAVRQHFAGVVKIPSLKGVRGDKASPESIRFKETHQSYADQLKNEFRDRFFSMSQGDIAAMNHRQALVIDGLYRLLSLFENRLTEEKRRRQILDFGDMKRYALRLLWDGERNCPTEAARQEALKYDEIYIDEYQDVSPVQDRIFSSIANKDNRFMVGDAKQSIYGFRGASPELFLGYRARFEAEPDAGRTIFLSNNFRCDRQVIDGTNTVFSVLFGRGGSLPYTDADALVYSKRPEGVDTQTKLTLALIASGKDAQEDDAPESPEDEVNEAYTEADWVADKIHELLRSGTLRNGERLRPRDIAVLVRSAKNSAQAIAAALDKHRIPVYNTESKAFFENAEVLLMFSLLSVIDNPQKDVYLAGVLKSPLYHVTLDELVHIRMTYPSGSLCDALQTFVKETGFAKGRYFLDKLALYRSMAAGMPVDRFLWYLYQDTGILSLVYQKDHSAFAEDTDSAQMRANLMMFYEYARSFERGSFRGLYQFVLFIEDVIADKAKMPAGQLVDEDADAVRIITIHHSKGLEFPVCFVAGLGSRRSNADQRANINLDREGGIATLLTDDTRLVRINHPVRECVKQVISDRQAEEEMRVLYVALTRAREQLYLSASVRNPEKTVADSISAAGMLTPRLLRDQSTMLAWLLTAFAASPGGLDGLTICYPTGEEKEAAEVPETEVPTTAEPAQEDNSGITYAAAKRLIAKNLPFVYPHAAEVSLPAKTAVSDLIRAAEAEKEKPTDDKAPDEKSPSEPLSREASREYARPRFLSDTEAPATAAQRGTATHVFMQFCDYRLLAASGVDAEIERLLSDGFITAETAARIDRASLRTFTESALFARLQKAKDLRREVRFNLHMPASLYDPQAPEDTRILVQGIIDCYFTEENGRVILLDYKTDHFSHAVLRDHKAAEAILRERHGFQLACYKDACEALLCRPVDEVRIYSFALGYDFSV